MEPTDRARTDESHRLALLHPEYDGFIVLEITAIVDVTDARVVPVGQLEQVLTPHHAVGPLRAGQVRPVDLEVHPGAVSRPATSGLLRIVDDADTDIAPPVRVTLATDRSFDCILAGTVDGPWTAPGEFGHIVGELESGVGPVRQLARRVQRLQDGGTDPGWGRDRLGRRRR